MKNIIYNLILAVIGLVIVYIIYLNYLGPNQEGFEGSTESTAAYDPTDAVKPNDAQAKAQVAHDPNKATAETPTSSDMSPPVPSITDIEAFHDDDDDDDDDDEEYPGFVANLYNYFFNPEGFHSRRRIVDPNAPKRPSYPRRRTRRWTVRRRWHREWHATWRNWQAALRAYYIKKASGATAAIAAAKAAAIAKEKEKARLAAIAKAKAEAAARARAILAAATARRAREAAAKPFIDRHKQVSGNLAYTNDLFKKFNKIDTDKNAQNRAGADATRAYKLSYSGRQYWNNWRDQRWLASGLYHTKRLTPAVGRHYDWNKAGNINTMIKGVNDKIVDKRRRDAEAAKTNMRKANWSTLFNKAKTRLGPFNEDNKGYPTASFEATLGATYGVSKSLASWKPELINVAHKLIDDEYDRIQKAKQAQLRARSSHAYDQMAAAKEAANVAAAASAAIATAEREAAKQAAEKSNQQAAATANAVKNMTGTLNTTNKNVANSTARLGGYVNGTGPGGLNQINASVLKIGEGPRKAMSDLLTVQTAKLSTFNAVPMDAIKALSLKARQKYNAGIAAKG